MATVDEAIIGLLVAEIKPYAKCNHEDAGGLLGEGEDGHSYSTSKSNFNVSNDSTDKGSRGGSSPRVAYILTLGVVGHWRRHGVATILLARLSDNLTANPMLEDVKALYLHVLTTNTAAIHFYEKMAFRRHRFLPLYYLINSSAADGYCYARYINGGRPPPTLLARLLGLLLRSWSWSSWWWWCSWSSCSNLGGRLARYLPLRRWSSKYGTVSPSPVRYKGRLYTC